MAVSASFLAFASDLLAPFGDISIRKMFGGAGVYCDGLFFALLDDEAIWLKVDDETRPAFERAGLQPFKFEMKDGSMASMSYYGAPGEFYDDADETGRWTALALDAARRAANSKKKPANKAASSGAATGRRKPAALKARK